jgi:hypothetical protein
MMFAERRTGNGMIGRGRARLVALSLAAGLAVAMASQQPAWASSAEHASTEAHSGTEAPPEPIFGLPPILIQIPENGGPELKVIVFKASLIFDEVDPERINDSQRIAKSLLPKIMDSVITGMQRHHFADATATEDVTQVVLDSSNAVLKPYGVIIKHLKMEHLGIH